MNVNSPMTTKEKPKKLPKTDLQSDNRKRKCPVEFNVSDNKISAKAVEDREGLFQSLVGTPNEYLAKEVVTSAVNALPNSLDSASKYNLITQTLADSTPKDAHEAQLVAQATVLYVQGMDFLERARRVLFDDTLAKDHWHNALMKTATKLLDLHLKTSDAIIRYRHKGEHKITVQHVTVQDGGKAIVNGSVGSTP